MALGSMPGGFSGTSPFLPIGMLLASLVQGVLLARMGRPHLSLAWLVVFLCFWILTTLAYGWLGLISQSAFWSGCFALIAVYGIWRYIQQVYSGMVQRRVLFLSALACGIAGWFSAIAGGLTTLAIGIFSVLHSFLHEREEKGVSYTQVSNQAVFHRWRKRWGVFWLVPVLMTNGLVALGLWLWGDLSLAWKAAWVGLRSLHDIPFGYFSTFHQEFQRILNPLAGEVWGAIGLRIPVALWFSGLGILPVLGILGKGYQVPNRFVYRFLQRPDEELLLLWLGATALILATLFQSDSTHIALWGSLSWLLGFVVLSRWLNRRPKMERQFRRLLFWFLGWLLVAILLSLL